jgi:NADH-quinone oxidoreductase subunit B
MVLLVKVFATKLNDVVGLANSLWPLPFATSCCGIEFMATMASHYDLARFGSERVSFLLVKQIC